MLDSTLSNQLREHFKLIRNPVALLATMDDSSASSEMKELVEELTALSTMISHRVETARGNAPLLSISGNDTPPRVIFKGTPAGHEFTSLILSILQAGGHPSKISSQERDRIQSIDKPMVFKTYYSQSCHNCPEVVQALNLLASINPNISHVAIDGGAFQAEVEELGIMGVPAVFLNDQLFSSGRSDLNTLLSLLESSQPASASSAPAQRAPYDVLVIGAGPAGAAAAVYAARKGIRVGIVADRFGGQTLDTLGIENFISVLNTQGPKFAADLEAHVRSYGVDVIAPHKAISRTTNTTLLNHHDVTLESGEVLSAKTIILALGAKWRNMNIPGEDTYKNKGVAYCPHCDGPLFKDKPVAVIGGGNSGVEAAIDLAGLCSQVTLLEFAGQLRADAVLQNKLRSLSNVTIIVNAKTTEVKGDGKKVTGLAYEDTTTSETKELPLSGIFVQIGLAPNTEWAKPFVNLSPRGEILVDDRRATSTPGIFAAGDATTVPYKQIIIASGDGATAALSAFDYLMRN